MDIYPQLLQDSFKIPEEGEWCWLETPLLPVPAWKSPILPFFGRMRKSRSCKLTTQNNVEEPSVLQQMFVSSLRSVGLPWQQPPAPSKSVGNLGWK